jgi:hypothetical protein
MLIVDLYQLQPWIVAKKYRAIVQYRLPENFKGIFLKIRVNFTEDCQYIFVVIFLYVCKNKINMRKAFKLAVILLAFLPAISFAQEKKVTWAEMKNFHSIMSATFHPAEEGNFTPIKEKAASLFAAAKVWQKSAIPDNFKEKETKEALKKLVIKCGAVDKGVQAGYSDENLKKILTEAHDIFHSIVGECQKAGE